MNTVHAVYENGVFRPTEEVRLPEHCVVEFEPRPVNGTANKTKALKRIHEILSHNHDTGIRELAARHNEHQPRASCLLTRLAYWLFGTVPTSFVVMRRLNIQQAFTNDRHFRAAGFEILFD